MTTTRLTIAKQDTKGRECTISNPATSQYNYALGMRVSGDYR